MPACQMCGTARKSVARMKPKAQYGDALAVPTPYCAALHTGYASDVGMADVQNCV